MLFRIFNALIISSKIRDVNDDIQLECTCKCVLKTIPFRLPYVPLPIQPPVLSDTAMVPSVLQVPHVVGSAHASQSEGQPTIWKTIRKARSCPGRLWKVHLTKRLLESFWKSDMVDGAILAIAVLYNLLKVSKTNQYV